MCYTSKIPQKGTRKPPDPLNSSAPPSHPANSYNSHISAPATLTISTPILAPAHNEKIQTYLLTNPLPTELALNRILDNSII